MPRSTCISRTNTDNEVNQRCGAATTKHHSSTHHFVPPPLQSTTQEHFLEFFSGNTGFIKVYAFDDDLNNTVLEFPEMVSTRTESTTSLDTREDGRLTDVITEAASRLSLNSCCSQSVSLAAVEDELLDAMEELDDVHKVEDRDIMSISDLATLSRSMERHRSLAQSMDVLYSGGSSWASHMACLSPGA